MKDNRSNWHRGRFLHQSQSPSTRDRPRRSPGHRSASIERREYASRRLDYVKQLHHEPLPPPETHSQPSPFGGDGYELPSRFMLPGDSANLNPKLNSGLKLSCVMKDEDFLQKGNGAPGNSSLGLKTHSLLLQKSLSLDDGPAQAFYALPADATYSADAAMLKSENTGRSSGPLAVGFHDYHDHLRDPINDRQGERSYSKDVSFATMATSQLRQYGDASSSRIPKDDLLGLYGDHLHQPLEVCIRDGPSKFLDDPFDRIGYSQMQLSEPVIRSPLSLARIEPRYYGYDELSQRERNNGGFLVSDDNYEKIPWKSHSDAQEKHSLSFRDLVGGRINELDASGNVTSESSLWERDQQHSLHEDAALDYHKVKGINFRCIDGSASGHLGYKIKPSRVHELASFEETYAFGTVDAPTSYKERPKSSMFSGHRMDINGQVIRSPQEKSEMDDFYQLSSERMSRRKYATDSNRDEFEPRIVASNDRSVFRRISSPNATDDTWLDEERHGVLHSKHMASGHTKYRTISRGMSRSDAWLPTGETLRHVEHGHGMSLKRRLRPSPSGSQGSYPSKRRKEFFRPYKLWKKDMVDQYDSLSPLDEYVPDDDNAQLKSDPAEGSEEFKKQVNRAFLQSFKLLNENPWQLKIHQEHGQGSPLLCRICGRMSKEFADTHSLVSHLYHSCKVGLKTEHLGLHKALCLLMGWNWLMAPDNSRVYQSRPVAEAKVLKEDLILWPPVVIVHNGSNEKKVSNSEQNILTNEGIQEILKEMGFEVEKTRICHGKPAKQHVILIKFSPIFSGLQEAGRLHKHFADNHQGRQQFRQMTANKINTDSKQEGCSKFEFLYGYMAVAEDLPKLDSEMKKRCLVKSKKDIEAIADAPLNI